MQARVSSGADPGYAFVGYQEFRWFGPQQVNGERPWEYKFDLFEADTIHVVNYKLQITNTNAFTAYILC